jgi:hypothetical protein
MQIYNKNITCKHFFTFFLFEGLFFQVSLANYLHFKTTYFIASKTLARKTEGLILKR